MTRLIASVLPWLFVVTIVVTKVRAAGITYPLAVSPGGDYQFTLVPTYSDFYTPTISYPGGSASYWCGLQIDNVGGAAIDDAGRAVLAFEATSDQGLFYMDASGEVKMFYPTLLLNMPGFWVVPGMTIVDWADGALTADVLIADEPLGAAISVRQTWQLLQDDDGGYGRISGEETAAVPEPTTTLPVLLLLILLSRRKSLRSLMCRHRISRSTD